MGKLRDIALQQQRRLPHDSDIRRQFNPSLISIARIGVQTSDHASDVSSALPRLLREEKSKFWQQHIAQHGYKLHYDGAWHDAVCSLTFVVGSVCAAGSSLRVTMLQQGGALHGQTVNPTLAAAARLPKLTRMSSLL